MKQLTIDLDDTTAALFEVIVAKKSDGKLKPEDGIKQIVIDFVGQNYRFAIAEGA